MSSEKKEIRQTWRDAVFTRDKHACVICAEMGTVVAGTPLQAHHITPRGLCPGGGYVVENGITVCERHHVDVEADTLRPGGILAPALLYKLIGTTQAQAFHAMALAADPTQGWLHVASDDFRKVLFDAFVETVLLVGTAEARDRTIENLLGQIKHRAGVV